MNISTEFMDSMEDRLWDIITDFRSSGGTILLTTHYMEEAEQLCDRVAIVDRGTIIAIGSPRELIASLGAEDVVEYALESERQIGTDELSALPGVQQVHSDAGRTVLTVTRVHQAVPALMKLLALHGVELSELVTHHATLEDVFLSLTGRHLRDE